MEIAKINGRNLIEVIWAYENAWIKKNRPSVWIWNNQGWNQKCEPVQSGYELQWPDQGTKNEPSHTRKNCKIVHKREL